MFNHLLLRLSYVSPSSVESIFNDVLKWGSKRSLQPDNSSYFHLFKSLSAIRKVDKALEILQSVEFRPSVSMYNVLIGALASEKRDHDASRLFDEMVVRAGLTPDIHTYNALIDSYAKTGNLEGAMKVLKSIQATQVNPLGRSIYANEITFNAILSLLSSKRMMKDAEKVIENMVLSGLKPSCVTLNILSKLLVPY